MVLSKRASGSGIPARRTVLLFLLLAVGIGVLPLYEASATGSKNGPDEHNIERFAIKRVQPPYPEMAQRYKLQGTVTVSVTVGGDGKVQSAEFVRGQIVFRSVSLDAAKRWIFKAPGGEKLQGTINFVFKLEG
ncbi:MAG TPA: TonB family protein [Blastocatellia bacterium]|nr:TonB family protein [Blastocatellia bacterium]